MSSLSKIKDSYIKSYANMLAKEGERLILEAYRKADFKKDKTQNLHDSYGSAVYYNGKYVYGTKRFLSRRAVEPRFNTYSKKNEFGFDAVNEYLDSYKPTSKGFELIAVAAMFYAEILEKGKGRLRRKYRVISGLSGSMDDLAKRTGGIVANINL